MALLIQSISIINEAGLPVVDVSSRESIEDVTLLAGLTSALQAFATEFSGGKNIHSLDFKDYSLVYSPVSRKGVLCVRMSREISSMPEMADIITKEITKEVEAAGTAEIDMNVVFDESYSRYSNLLKKFLEINHINKILQPHGYQVRSLDRSLCVISTLEKEGELKGTYEYRHNLTDDEALAVLNDLLPKFNLISITNGEESSVIHSFPSINKIGIISYFIPYTSENHIIESNKSAIILLYDEKDQVSLYKHTPVLKRRLTEVSNTLAQNWLKKDELPNFIKELLSVGQYHITARKSMDRDTVSFELLRKVAKKNLDRVIRNIIVGKQVVITGEPVLGELVVGTLETFAIHRVLTMALRSGEKSSADLVTTSKEYISEYNDSDTVILDLEKTRVSGGTSSKFCQQFLKRIEKMKRLDVISYIETEVRKIVTQATTLSDLALLEEAKSEELQKYRNSLNEDSLEIITEIAAAANPLISHGIRKTSQAISSVESYLAKF